MRILPAAQLEPRHWDAWLAFQRENPELDSPYFHPQFVRGLDAVGRPVQVAVVEEDAKVLALYPFEQRGRSAHAAGWPMADYQGPVCAPGFRFDVAAFMREAGLDNLLFDHLLASRTEFQPHIERVRPSTWLDVSGGLEAYKARLSDTGKKTLSDTLRFGRKAGREVGELRLEFQTKDDKLLDQLIEWKRRQYRETGADDFFADDANRAYMRNLLLQREDPDFQGVLTALWAGEKLLALHLGMRSRGVLHWWFPVYDSQYQSFSPGRIMLAKMAELAPQLGLTKVDLGKGEDAYKMRCMTGSTSVAEGYVEVRPLARWWRRTRNDARDAIKGSALYGKARDWKRGRLAGKKT